MYLAGAIIMSYNLWRTVRMPGSATETSAAAKPALASAS